MKSFYELFPQFDTQYDANTFVSNETHHKITKNHTKTRVTLNSKQYCQLHDVTLTHDWLSHKFKELRIIFIRPKTLELELSKIFVTIPIKIEMF